MKFCLGANSTHDAKLLMIDLSIYDYCYDFKKHFKEILNLAQKLMQNAVTYLAPI